MYGSEHSNGHDSRSTRPSRSSNSEIDRHSDLHRCKKKVSIKVNPYRKSRDNKIDLVRDQLDSECSNRNGPSKNNNARRR
ncbi:nuclear RNA export factor 1-like isoform X2 [Aphis craccivora]|uniref:Nuclear RNA export factor 1-like isoform X2 n=1 Tax=Aphis craccivora TaxID=307492 RepID=A0A6G0VRZ8_APHCR|nr:nuclear RNA export factor 1-like isoform X2 [Aphis craccivora]